MLLLGNGNERRKSISMDKFTLSPLLKHDREIPKKKNKINRWNNDHNPNMNGNEAKNSK